MRGEASLVASSCLGLLKDKNLDLALGNSPLVKLNSRRWRLSLTLESGWFDGIHENCQFSSGRKHSYAVTSTV
ncbi:hypothetical protein RRG08_034446 [Elysia crispata]|uniref:Uncharacterized protein n=1 Tax=Elysia crispata TaxID=231223 RepID=A0AAE1CL48_9GAST|nr:hypothetical protein RRG08_034446 [Elysia crispata]